MKEQNQQAHELAWSVYYQIKYSKTMTVQQVQSASQVLLVASDLLSNDFGDADAKPDTLACSVALKALADSYGDLSLAQASKTKVPQKQYMQHLPLLYWL